MNCWWLSMTSMSEKPSKAAVLGGPTLSQAFPPGAQPGSHGEDMRRMSAQVSQGDRKSRHYEILFRAFSTAKAHSPARRTSPGQILECGSSCRKEMPLYSSPLQPSCLMQGKTTTATTTKRRRGGVRTSRKSFWGPRSQRRVRGREVALFVKAHFWRPLS